MCTTQQLAAPELHGSDAVHACLHQRLIGAANRCSGGLSHQLNQLLLQLRQAGQRRWCSRMGSREQVRRWHIRCNCTGPAAAALCQLGRNEGRQVNRSWVVKDECGWQVQLEASGQTISAETKGQLASVWHIAAWRTRRKLEQAWHGGNRGKRFIRQCGSMQP